MPPGSRFALAAVAVVACAWLVLAAVQAHGLQAAEAIVEAPGAPSDAEAARAERLLDRASRLNPGSGPELVRAVLALERGDAERFTRIVGDVVAREPDNIHAWARLAVLTRRSDPEASARAEAQVRRLSPPVPAPGR